MIKGHIQIELHNHKTGFRERIEKDNLVTNAMGKVIGTLVGRGQNASTFMPISTNLLGGIFLFEDPLTNLVTNIALPTTNTIIGYAGQTLNTSSKDMGSLNELESGPVENGYMNVWDFSTAQANGVISAMSLTNCLVGNGSLWTPLYTYYPISSTLDGQFSVVKRDDNDEYYLSTNSNGRIYKRYIPVNTYSINDVMNNVSSASNTGITVGDPSTTYNHSNWRDDGDGYIYVSRYASSKLYIEKYDDTDGSLMGTIEPSPTPDPTSGSLEFDTLDFSNSNFYRGNIFVRNGKIYIFNHMTDYDGIFVFDTSNYGSVYCEKMYTIQDNDLAYRGDSAIRWDAISNSWSRMYVTEDDTIWLMALVKNSVKGTYGYFKQVFIKEDNSITVIKVYDAIFNELGSALPYYRYDGINDISYYARIAANNMVSGNYLGTICNLDSPFEKTNMNSMKVKYTLTNV